MITIVLKDLRPTPLNRIYKPIIRNKRPSIIVSNEAKTTKRLIRYEVMKQKQNKMLQGNLTMKIDFCIKKGARNNDVDNSLKLLLDALQGLCYKDDMQIIQLEIRKHLNQSHNEYIVQILEVKE